MSNNTGEGLFGSNKTVNGSKNLFGSVNNNTSSSPFGQPSTSSPTTSAPAQPTSLFDNTSSNAGSRLIMGGNDGGNTRNNSAGSAFSSFPKKPEDNTPPGSGGLFGRVDSPNKPAGSDQQGRSGQGGSIFGHPPTTTPSKPLFGQANPSTTPAGPPPSNAAGGLFGSGGASTGEGLFGGQSKPAEGQNKPATSGGLFGAQTKTADAQQQPQLGGLFGSSAPKTSPSIFSPPASSPGQSIFQKPNQPASATQSNNQPATSSPATITAPTISSPFTLPTAKGSGTSTPTLFPPTPASTAPASTAPAAPSLFGDKPAQDSGNSTPKSQPSTLFGQQPTTTQAPAQTGGIFGQKTDTSNAPQQSTTSTANDLFGKPKQPASNETTVSSVEGTSQPPATSASAAPSFTLSAAPTSTQGNKTTTSTTATTVPTLGLSSSTTGGNAPLLSTSTSGPAPSAQSRLKNKTMDDIITRWSSDLLKYQKEFQSQAEKVAQWDCQLVENTNAISKLYSKTYQAERDTAEIQKQLSAVEGNQDELAQWLDRYEHEVDEMMARQVGQGDGMQGPDQERERTYRTAERVSERLGDMGKDLTSMIEEINTASASINKSAKSDDPLSQIVRILNGHLAQLQLIDRGTQELQGKISDAQRQSQRLGSRGRSGLGFDAADDFGRTFRSRG